MIKCMDRWDEKNLKKVVAGCISKAEVLKALGLRLTGGNYVTLDKKIKKFNINCDHFLGQSWVSKNKEKLYRQPLLEILIENSTYSTSHLRKRLLNEKIKEYICENCGLKEWLGDPIPLELDHINGIRDDHRIENLRFLCCNCHAMTPTWRGRNIQGSVAEID